MAAVRFVLHRDRLGLIDTSPLLRHLADEVASDAEPITPVDTGDLVSTVRVVSVDEKTAVVGAGGIPGAVTGEMVDYAGFVEQGTSRMDAQPYMRPALYKYRTP